MIVAEGLLTLETFQCFLVLRVEGLRVVDVFFHSKIAGRIPNIPNNKDCCGESFFSSMVCCHGLPKSLKRKDWVTGNILFKDSLKKQDVRKPQSHKPPEVVEATEAKSETQPSWPAMCKCEATPTEKQKNNSNKNTIAGSFVDMFCRVFAALGNGILPSKFLSKRNDHARNLRFADWIYSSDVIKHSKRPAFWVEFDDYFM